MLVFNYSTGCVFAWIHFYLIDTVDRRLYLHQRCDHRLRTSNGRSENILTSTRLCWQLGKDMTGAATYPTSLQQRPRTVYQADAWVHFPHRDMLWFHDNEYLRASFTVYVHVFIMLVVELHSGYVTGFLQCSTGPYIAITINRLSHEIHASKCIPWVNNQYITAHAIPSFIFWLIPSFNQYEKERQVVVQMTLDVFRKEIRYKVYGLPVNSFSLQALLRIHWSNLNLDLKKHMERPTYSSA